MIIPYKDRQIGQIYYCKGFAKEYIFQWNGKTKQLSIIIECGRPYSFCEDREFGPDWRHKRDEIIRLATPEEIELLLKADTEGELLPINNIINYEIY